MESERLSNLEQSKDDRKAAKLKHAAEPATADTMGQQARTLCGSRRGPIVVVGTVTCKRCLAIRVERNLPSTEMRKPPKRAPAKPKLKPDMWELLKGRIQEYTEAAVAESWKGGGDPNDIEIHELRLRITWIELCNHMARMKEELT